MPPGWAGCTGSAGGRPVCRKPPVLITNLLISLPFFAMVGFGYLAGRLKMMPEAGITGLNVFVFNFSLPALLFRLMANTRFEELINPAFMGAWLLTGVIVLGGTMALAMVLLRARAGEAALYGLGAEFSNSGYLGIPLVANLVGQKAAVAIALTIVVDLGLMLPLVLLICEFSQGGRKSLRSSLWTISKGVLLNPFMGSIALGGLVSFMGVGMPGPLDSLTALLGAAAGPCALFALGAVLAMRPVSGGTSEVALIVVGKLVWHPMVALVAMLWVFDVRPDWAVPAMLNAAIPPATNVFVLAERYGMQAERISTAILVATVLAMFTFTGYTAVLRL